MIVNSYAPAFRSTLKLDEAFEFERICCVMWVVCCVCITHNRPYWTTERVCGTLLPVELWESEKAFDSAQCCCLRLNFCSVSFRKEKHFTHQKTFILRKLHSRYIAVYSRLHTTSIWTDVDCMSSSLSFESVSSRTFSAWEFVRRSMLRALIKSVS